MPNLLFCGTFIDNASLHCQKRLPRSPVVRVKFSSNLNLIYDFRAIMLSDLGHDGDDL